MSMRLDASELRALATDLTGAVRRVNSGVDKVVARGALNIKNQLREEMGASAHFKAAARSINYDLEIGPAVVQAEIGPERGSPGSLANIAYFGTSRGGGTVPDPLLALAAEAPNVEAAIADLIDDLL